MARFKGVGIHVFAGGFTQGVQRLLDVNTHLECHGFGQRTAQALCGVSVTDAPAEEWHYVNADFAYGNPRCTGFSTLTAGYSSEAHGPWSKQCQDIKDFTEYVCKHHYPIAIWESVTQAASTGKPLLDYLIREHYQPAGYRIAHVFLSTAAVGNCQNRRRYLFVAYKGDKNFNIRPPKLAPRIQALWQTIGCDLDRTTNEKNLKLGDYDRDSCHRLDRYEKECVPHLATGWGLNALAKYRTDLLPDYYKATWKHRNSEKPFSLHCISRPNWLTYCPTLSSSSIKLLHPVHHRTMTVGEFARIMHWEDENGEPLLPIGKDPVAQLAKGVCPSVGQWVANQVVAYLNDDWGKKDFSLRYDPNACQWDGEHFTNRPLEKTFHLLEYYPRRSEELENVECEKRPHKHDVAWVKRGLSRIRD